MLPLVLLLLLGLSPSSGAKEMTEVVGPLRLAGKHLPMFGPHIDKTVRFKRNGLVTGFSDRVLDEGKKPVDDDSIWCHTSLIWPDLSPDKLRKDRLILGEGIRKIIFPDGFGFPIRASAPYRLNMMLQSQDESLNRDYYFSVGIHIAEEGKGPRLKNLFLLPLSVGHHDAKESISGWGDWWVPPRQRQLKSKSFTMPVSGTIHVMAPHLHRYATRLTLKEQNSGRVLYDEAPLEDGERRLTKVPYYSSRVGLPREKGRSYELSVVYDNPSSEKISVMAGLYLFIHPRGA